MIRMNETGLLFFVLLVSICCYDFQEDVQAFEKCLLIEKETTIAKKGCTEKNITVKYCSGRCTSFAMYSSSYPYFKTNCRCCKAVKMKALSTIVYCKDGSILEDVLYDEAVECQCRKCDSKEIK